MRISHYQGDSVGNKAAAAALWNTGFFQGCAAFWIKLWRMVLVSAAVLLNLSAACPAGAQTLTIVSDPYPPLGYVKNGEIVGFTVDLIKLLQQRTGIEGKFVMYPWARAYEMAQKEKDILIYQLTYTEERARLFQLVGPIYHATDSLWKLKARKDIVLRNLKDATQYRVGTVRDYFTHKYLLENGFQEGRNLDAVHDDDMNVQKLASGRIDLMFLDELVFNYRVKELGYKRDDFDNAFPVVSHDEYLAFSRQTSPDLVSRFAKALLAMKKDGSYNGILRKYGIHPPEGKAD